MSETQILSTHLSATFGFHFGAVFQGFPSLAPPRFYLLTPGPNFGAIPGGLIVFT